MDNSPDSLHPTNSPWTTPPPPERANPISTGQARDLLPIGEGYQLIRVIGKGTFGEVWEALAPGGFPAAVKIIRRTADNEEIQQESRALEVLRRLQHPSLLQVTAAWHLEDRLVVAMELASGNLRQRLKECQEQGSPGIPREELLAYLRDAAAALDYLHANKVLHRDVKPDNILLRGGLAKVADFGLVRDQNQIATIGRVVGTPAYMAPEAWRGRSEETSDQYSLACTYAELRCGGRPFDNDRRADAAPAPPRPTLGGADVRAFFHVSEPDLSLLDPGERPVLARALAWEPANRFASCAEMVRALEEAQSGSPAPRAGRRRLRALVVIGLGCVIGLGIASVCRPRPGAAGRAVTDPVYLPPRYEPAPGATVDEQGTPYHSHIVRRINGQEAVFRLIRPDAPGAAPFYLLQDKVSNGLFRVFSRAEPSATAKSLWQLGAMAGDKELGNDNDRLPVFCVTRREGERCAVWLGGQLPTAAQLDQAARRATRPGRGVGRWQEGPVEIEAGRHEEVHDLDGNGREWTRDVLRIGEETLAVLHGRSDAAPAGPPPNPADAETTATQYPRHASPYTTFRVVIELPPP